jgi:hypothetical protein
MSVSLGRTLDSFRRLAEGHKIVATDFSTTVLISHIDENLTTVECEVQPLSLFVPLRYLLASYIRGSLPYHYLALDTDRRTTTKGAPNNLHFSLPCDDEKIATRHAHSDFDIYKLANSWPAIEQFFR